MSEETVEVRELILGALGPDGHEATLTLTDDKLVVAAIEDAPLPEWLRGEIGFDGLDVVYVDPTKERKPDEEAEDEEEEPMPPGFRISRVIEVANEATGETFPRTATIALDSAHLDLERAKAFALTFARLAGRPIPEEKAAGEVAAEPAPTEGAEAAAEAAPTAAPEEETPAFARPEEPEEKAFV